MSEEGIYQADQPTKSLPETNCAPMPVHPASPGHHHHSAADEVTSLGLPVTTQRILVGIFSYFPNALIGGLICYALSISSTPRDDFCIRNSAQGLTIGFMQLAAFLLFPLLMIPIVNFVVYPIFLLWILGLQVVAIVSLAMNLSQHARGEFWKFPFVVGTLSEKLLRFFNRQSGGESAPAPHSEVKSDKTPLLV